MSEMGRSRKLDGARQRVQVYFDERILKKVDEIVFKAKDKNRDYSRSDFVNEAIQFYLDAKEGKKNGKK